MLDTPKQASQKAIEEAKSMGRCRLPVGLDTCGTRKFFVVDESYINTDEYDAFNGYCYGIAYPDGTFEEDI